MSFVIVAASFGCAASHSRNQNGNAHLGTATSATPANTIAAVAPSQLKRLRSVRPASMKRSSATAPHGSAIKNARPTYPSDPRLHHPYPNMGLLERDAIAGRHDFGNRPVHMSRPQMFTTSTQSVRPISVSISRLFLGTDTVGRLGRGRIPSATVGSPVYGRRNATDSARTSPRVGDLGLEPRAVSERGTRVYVAA